MTLPRLNITSLSQEEVCGDIVEAFRLAIQRLGYPTTYTHRYIEPGVINILFFFWDVPWSVIEPHHPDCIIVNFEPMVPGTHAWSQKYLEVLEHSYVWEYSKSNFQRNRELRYRNADYVALGWEPDAAEIVPLADILPQAQQDIDVLFFGSLTQRRIAILEALMARGLRVELNRVGHWTLQERNGYLRRAKVVLNLHNWEDSRIVEVPRLSILMRHRKAVVCELYPDSEIEPWMRKAVVGASYAGLVETVQALLADAPRRAALEREGLDIFTRPWLPPLVGPAIERFLEWRAQQPDRLVAGEQPRVSVCLVAGSSPEALVRSLQSLAAQAGVGLQVVLVATADSEVLEDLPAAAALAALADLRVLRLPVALDRATGRNIALAQSTGDYVVFLEAGDVAAPERLQRQADLLETRPGIDIAGCWCETQDGVLHFAERHQDIVAEFLGPQPLLLSACMVRRSFLERSGIRHDPEFTAHDDLHLLCKSVAAGARLAVVAQVLHRPASLPQSRDPEREAALAMRARALVLACLLPRCSGEDVAQIAHLYAHLWPPSLEFAERLLGATARACVMPWSTTERQAVEHETLTRALRHETLRLLQVFFDAGLADRAWLERQFALDEVAAFLGPAANQLPVRIFRG